MPPKLCQMFQDQNQGHNQTVTRDGKGSALIEGDVIPDLSQEKIFQIMTGERR